MQLLASPLDEEAAAEVTARNGVPCVFPLKRVRCWMRPWRRELRARWPDAALDIREGSGSELEEWVLRRRVDIAVSHRSADASRARGGADPDGDSRPRRAGAFPHGRGAGIAAAAGRWSASRSLCRARGTRIAVAWTARPSSMEFVSIRFCR